MKNSNISALTRKYYAAANYCDRLSEFPDFPIQNFRFSLTNASDLEAELDRFLISARMYLFSRDATL